MTQLARSRAATQKRLEAHLRAAAALDAVRRDIASTLRSDDLFQTRFLIVDKTQSSRIGDIARDELLVFSSRLSAVRPNKYQGEGEEYETQFRVADDELGAALWQRRDPVPDRTPDGGGVVTPIVDGVVALNLEASDGETWFPDWDSDIYGLPWAVRATVTTVGQADGEDPYADLRNVVSLRATIALDRIVPPKTEEEAAEDKAQSAADDAEEALNNGGVLPGEVPDGGPRPGGGGPGSGGPGSGGPGAGGPGGGGPGGGGQVGGGGMGGRGGGPNGFGSRGSRGGAARTRGGPSSPGGGTQ
ncbi:MAG: hypothetical protein SGJ09_08720 [Phycisphaerae bacterium]|nr:hypothetical protein [Phycisphaerae bacterium]